MQKIICVSCFSQIVLKNNGFKDEYLKDNLIYRCPFCKSNTKINVKVNHAINNNIIKSLIKSQSNDNDEGGLMDRFLDHFMISHNTELLVQNNELKKEIKNLKKELENKQYIYIYIYLMSITDIVVIFFLLRASFGPLERGERCGLR